MARGWESKSVEAQQEEAAAARQVCRILETPEQAAQRARREALNLQRTRILSELQAACNPRFRGQLESALAHLDAELARFTPGEPV